MRKVKIRRHVAGTVDLDGPTVYQGNRTTCILLELDAMERQADYNRLGPIRFYILPVSHSGLPPQPAFGTRESIVRRQADRNCDPFCVDDRYRRPPRQFGRRDTRVESIWKTHDTCPR